MQDAPPVNLPAEVRDLEERRGLLVVLAHLQSAVQEITHKVDNHKGDAERLVHELFRKFGPAKEKPFIASGSHRRFKVHEAVVDGTARLPQR